jgi:hypothetical protein
MTSSVHFCGTALFKASMMSMESLKVKATVLFLLTGFDLSFGGLSVHEFMCQLMCCPCICLADKSS